MVMENAIEEFRKLNPDFQTQGMMTFLWIARGHEQAKDFMEDTKDKDDCYMTVSTIARKMNISEASASRNVSNLSGDTNRYGKEGYGLVENKTFHCQEKRTRLIRLTNKGEEMARKLRSIMRGDTEIFDYAKVSSSVENSRKGYDPKTGLGKGMKEDINRVLQGGYIEGASKRINNDIQSHINRFRASGASLTEVQDLIASYMKSDGARKEQIGTIHNARAEGFIKSRMTANAIVLKAEAPEAAEGQVGKVKVRTTKTKDGMPIHKTEEIP